MNKEEWIIGYQYGLLENLQVNPIGSITTRFETPCWNGFYAARAHGQYLSREEVEQCLNQITQ